MVIPFSHCVSRYLIYDTNPSNLVNNSKHFYMKYCLFLYFVGARFIVPLLQQERHLLYDFILIFKGVCNTPLLFSLSYFFYYILYTYTQRSILSYLLAPRFWLLASIFSLFTTYYIRYTNYHHLINHHHKSGLD